MNTIEFTRDAGVARVALNRPDKLNSFTRQMHADLRDAITQCERDETIRAVVITGNGRAFCAGQDLADLSFEPGNMSDLGALIQDNFNPLIRRIQALPKPGQGWLPRRLRHRARCAISVFLAGLRQHRTCPGFRWYLVSATSGRCRASDGPGDAWRETVRRTGRTVGTDLALRGR